MTRIRRTYLTVLVVLLAPMAANAVPILDQQSIDTSLHGYQSRNWQQGVTVGLAGNLTQLDFYATTSGTTDIDIFAGSPWQVSGSLATVNLVVTGEGWQSVDLSGLGLFFNVGDQFTWSANGTVDMAGSSAFAGAYDGGIAVFNIDLFFDGARDLAFRSYVETATVPEPGTLALLGIGLAGLGLTRRRRKV